MRAVLFILIVAVIAIIAAFATGFLNLSQTREARVPEIAATHNGVTATGGQAPAFDVETGSVKVGTRESTVKVPAVVVERAGREEAAATTNNGM